MAELALINLTLAQLVRLLLVFLRTGPLIFLMPVTGSRGVPVQVRVLCALACALVLAPVVDLPADAMPGSAAGVFLLAGKEIVFGAILALFARLVFAAVETAGQMAGVQMGLGVAGVMDPQNGAQTSLIGYFWNLCAVLIFLAVNGHHIFFRTLLASFRTVPMGGLSLSQATFEGVVRGAGWMFVLAVKIMAPVTAALFFSQVAMGIIAKTVPQIPVLIVALPLNIALGLVFVGLGMAFMTPLLIHAFDSLGRLLPQLAAGL